MDVFVARQPIFNVKGELDAYELLYRRTAASRFADGDSTGQMSADVVVQTFLEVGLDQITRGKTGFINFSEGMLLGSYYDLLDPGSIVVELLEDVEATPEVEVACARLVKRGYRLALDDFVVGGSQESLIPLADIVKVDVLNRTPEEVGAYVQPLLGRNVRLLAERVETVEIHDECKRIGFELFQGYFYSRPEVVANQGVSVAQTSMIKLMSLLGSEDASDLDIENGFRHDAALSYKLLRMLSTAAQEGKGVDSIRYALRLVGRGTLQRWLSLLLASSLGKGGGTDMEIVHTAVLRARFCELLGVRAGKTASADALFLVGLFSMMDSLLRMTMEDLLSRIDLKDTVRKALLHRSGPLAEFLLLAEAYEAGEWESVTTAAPAIGLPTLDVPAIYLDAATWSREQVSKAQ